MVRLLRRVHLFAGLSLLPWVVLYGATALMFNHPNAWRNDRQRELGVVDGPRMPPASAWIGDIVRGMGPTAQLVPADTARAYGEVLFRVSVRDTVYDAFYDATSGKIIGRVAGGGTTSVLQFLTELHTTRGYQTPGWARVVWAVAVDATAVLMLFWAASGLLMWWQLRALRPIGGLILALSGLAALMLAAGLHRTLAQR